MPDFVHLHSHTQYSLLDGAASIKGLYQKAAQDGMKALAITDHGNMFGVFDFVAEAAKHEGVKPIIGCEFYLVENRHQRTFTKEVRDKRFHQLFLSKNETGYKNLTKLCSLGYIEGLYGKYPRIDKELVLQHHEGLIATTCCLGAEVPQAILRKSEAEAKKIFEWWFNIFGEDYYIEIQRHGIPDQEKVNRVLLQYAKDYNVKIICSNDSHYIDQNNYNAHDILLCINTGEKKNTPVFKDFDEDNPMPKNHRFGFFNDQFYFKTKQEMADLFKDVPESLDNTMEIVDKVEKLSLKKEILLPFFDVPFPFQNQDEYLRHLTYEGAAERYVEITQEVKERLDFELFTIETMGFAGYFLIVGDFIRAGRDMGVFIGPGRGSAAGSAVAYCIGITNIDPIKYNLLFERFLNPDRKSMPDIDTDFDDEGRQKVIDYVVKKYGQNQVAHIVTYGTMAAKMSIKDVARVLDLPLDRANRLAKLVPDKPGIKLNRVIKAPIDGEGSLTEKEELRPDDIENVKLLREFYNGTDMEAAVLKEALVLEGSVRGTGIHAAGIIIAPKDLKEILPVCTVKDTHLQITQFEGSIIEDAGVIKMDFLGLKTLTIIKDALEMILANHGKTFDMDKVDLEDEKAYELYQKGETTGTFQFESTGMQKYLKDLKPDKLDDLIAMNALYRPGPIEYIPDFIARKHGRQEITYDLPEMEEFLHETYGITVYQEQVMLLSQKLAGFSKGDADVLRKAMGKKQKAVLDKMKGQFLAGAKAKGHPEDKLEKIWTDWEKFAQYAFNKSHSTCYAFVAYQTGWLKAHYPSEYMASVLTHNQQNIKNVTFFMEECRRMGIPVLSPDVNESGLWFSVNKKGEIRMGLGAIKGLGEGSAFAIIEERNKNGAFTDVFDIVSRVNPKSMNKKVMEALTYSGALDFDTQFQRYQYFGTYPNGELFMEKLSQYGVKIQQSKQMSETSLFGGETTLAMIEKPIPPADAAIWSEMQALTFEKEAVGFYLSSHPLNRFALEAKYANCFTDTLEERRDRDVKLAVIITSVQEKIAKNGNKFGIITVEDFHGSMEFAIFGEDYLKYRHLFLVNECLMISGLYQKGFRDPTAYEFRFKDARMLEGLLELYSKAIVFACEATSLQSTEIQNLLNICQKFPGKQAVRFDVGLHEQRVHFESKQIRVSVSERLLSELKENKVVFAVE